MKNILYALIILTGIYSCKAQTYPMEGDVPLDFSSGIYFKDLNNNFNKFAGTWEYVDATKRLRIDLQKIEDYEDSDYFSDVIVGNIIYEENGVEIINTLTNPSTSQGSDDIYHIKMFSIKEPTVIAGFFEDPVRSKWTTYSLYLRYSLSLTANGQPQLQWVVTIRDFYNPDGDVDAEQASRVPKFLTLTKI